MAHDLFISYSSHDKSTADAVCAVMEHRGIRCWMAPRDIIPGADWATSIIQAINSSKVFLLIFSQAANTSGQVKREVERAANRNLPIIPFRITDTAPNETLEFFISTPHWLDAFTPPLHGHAERLADTVERLIGPAKAWPEPPAAEPAPSPQAAESKAAKPKGAKTQAGAAEPQASTETAQGLIAAYPGFFMLGAIAIGVCLYSAASILPGANPYLWTPFYGVPVLIGLWAWRKIGLVQAVIWLVVMTAAHFVATNTTISIYGKAIKDGPLNDAFSFLIGGLIGGGLSLLALVLLGRALARRANLAAALIWTIVLGLAAAVSGLFGATSKHIEFTLYIPWQILFGLAIMAVADGRAWPRLQTGDGVLPPASARGGMVFGVLVTAAALAVTVAQPDMFKKKAETAPVAETTAPAGAAAAPAAGDTLPSPTAAPAPAGPAPPPAESFSAPASAPPG